MRISTQRRARDSRSMVASTARRAPRFCTDSERNFFFGSKKCCYAQRKAGAIDEARHLVIRSAHPSPLSAHGGFLGSRPFSQANAFLEAQGRGGIDWGLPPIETDMPRLL